MRRRLICVLVVGTMASLVDSLQAQNPWNGYYPATTTAATTVRAQSPDLGPDQSPSWWQRVKIDYHRNHCWPEPFIAGDRAAVKMPFDIQAENAWQRQNLLCDYHFVEGTSELNSAGQYRLRWIATKAPLQGRAVFIERMPSDAATNERIAAVQNALAQLKPRTPIAVKESNMGAGNWLGEDADATLRNLDKTRPEPRLPRATPTAISN
jgi:hypothetical protein